MRFLHSHIHLIVISTFLTGVIIGWILSSLTRDKLMAPPETKTRDMKVVKGGLRNH